MRDDIGRRSRPCQLLDANVNNKTGNGHLRRVLVEAAWAYQHRPNVIGYLARRQKDLAISEEAKQIAWKAQHRPHKRYKAIHGGAQRRPTKRRPSHVLCGTVSRTQPARLVRGNSRRIMTMRFRPANTD